MDEINHDLSKFQEEWNHHPISRLGHDQSPLVSPKKSLKNYLCSPYFKDIRLLSELKHGKYNDILHGIHPETLHRYYGTQSLAGAVPQNLENMISTDQQHQIRHEPVKVPDHSPPFAVPEAAEIFLDALEEINAAEIIPDGLGVAEGEWDVNGYPESEEIKVGRKTVEIQLPFSVWWPRAVRWACTLELLVHIQTAENH